MQWLSAHPFISGLAVGLIVALAVWIRSLIKQLGATRQQKQLKDHLHTQMEITAKGTQSTLDELESLRQQNENLRITLATYKNKPGRAELRNLHVYDRAIRMMHEKAPGFGPAWENVLKEAELEIQKTETGVMPFIRKVLNPSATRDIGSLPESTTSETDTTAQEEPGDTTS